MSSWRANDETIGGATEIQSPENSPLANDFVVYP